jgi:hypothetical protein
MPVPSVPIPTSHRLLSAALGWLLVLAVLPAYARGPEPPLRVPLENLGFQPLSTQFLLDGSSMLTLHYVDDKHLLVTFVVHRLIPRLPNEPVDDLDRVVDAVLLELPNGRILARTTWHLHDHSKYLWNLGHGHFLLRVRDNLTTFAPLANLETGQPFAQGPFLTSTDRRIAALVLSPDADLLIIETLKRTPPKPKSETPLFGPTPTPGLHLAERNLVQINFYRLHPRDSGDPVKPIPAGVVQAGGVGDVPASTAGFLAVVDQGRQHYAFDFHSFTGKIDELAPFDSTCPPAPVFVSHSEFIAFGCRTSHTMQQVGGFNMRGEEMWEQGLFGDYTAPSLAYAPAGGRFALSRIMLHGSVVPDQPISADEISAQTVVVYQTNTGKQLLRADCSPVERAGQNFALSPNGLGLAIVHADAIEVYSLPPLTSKEQAELKLAQASAPPENDLPVHFTAKEVPSSATQADADSPERPGPQLPAAAPPEAVSAPPDSNESRPANVTPEPNQPPPVASTPTSATESSGDPAPGQHRAPPTLYTLPDDKPRPAPKDTPQ